MILLQRVKGRLSKLPGLPHRRAETSAEEMAIVILVFAVTASIAVLTFNKIMSSLPSEAKVKGSSLIINDTNATLAAFNSNFYSSVQLLGVALIVMAAVTIISVIMWLRAR